MKGGKHIPVEDVLLRVEPKPWNEWTFKEWWDECEFSEGIDEAESAWRCQQVVIDWQASTIQRLKSVLFDASEQIYDQPELEKRIEDALDGFLP